MKIIKKTQMVTRGPKLSNCLSKDSIKTFPNLLNVLLVSQAINDLKLF